MKILVTTPFRLWPPFTGSATRTLGIATALSAIGHRVSLLAAAPAGPADQIPDLERWSGFTARGRAGHFFNPSFKSAYCDALPWQPELIVASFPYGSAMLVGPARRARIPLVYDAHNVETERFRQTGQGLKALLVRTSESHLCRHATAVLTVSNADRDLFERHFGIDAVLLPNGVDAERFAPGAPDPELVERLGLQGRKVVLFFGALDYAPNEQALSFLCDGWPRVLTREPEARLLAVGRHPPDWAKGRTGIVVTGPVEDIAGHIRLATLVAAPLSFGGGTRLKIIEALACGRTVLATPFAAQGIAGDGKPDALRLAERDRFFDTLLALLATPPLPDAESEAVQFAFGFDWKQLVSRIDWGRLTDGVQRP